MKALVKNRFLILLIAAKLAIIVSVDGQPTSGLPKLDHFKQRDGLSNHWIRDIIQDRRGFIWLATDNSLNRFDGVDFKVYTTSDKGMSPPRDFNSQRFALDDNGKFWMLDRYGLSSYNETTDSFFYIDLPAITFPINADHHLLFDGASKSLWLSTSMGVFRYDLVKRKLFPTVITKMYRPFESLIDSNGNLLIAASEGVYVYDISRDSYRFYKIDEDFNEHCLSIFQDRSGNIWIGRFGKGLMLFDPSSGYATHYSPPKWISGYVDVVFQDITTVPEISGDSVLWLATQNHGILTFNLNRREFVDVIRYNSHLPDGLVSNNISCFYRASDGIYWIANEGLSKLDFANQQLKSQKLEIPGSEFSVFLKDVSNPDLGWIATFNEGLLQYDLKKHQIVKTLHKSDSGMGKEWSKIFDICYDADGNLWVAGLFGISLFDAQMHEKVIPFRLDQVHYGVSSIAIESPDLAWLVVGNNILCRYDRKNGEKQYFKVPKSVAEDDPPYINCLLVEKEFVYLGSVFGLYQFDKHKRKFVKRFLDHSANNITNSNWVNHIWSDKSGKKWIAYADHGIKSLGPSENNLVSYPATKNLSVRFVEGDSHGKLWLQTGNGICRFDPASNKIEDFTDLGGIIEFDESTTPPLHNQPGEWGLISRSRYFLGLEINKVPQLLPTAKPIFTSFNIFNKPVSFNPDSTALTDYYLKHSQNVISFSFSSPLYTRSDRVTFDYMLEGFDKNWIHGGKQRMVSYTNLDGGFYVFKVRSYNAVGEMHQEPSIFRLLVQTPYWRTGWFVTICGMFLVILVAGVFSYREKNRKHLVKIRDDIARDLHDDMGSNLSSIRILSENVGRLIKRDPEKATITLNRISNTAREVMETMSDIVWSVNPENDYVGHLVDRMRDLASEVLEVARIEFNFETNLETEKVSLSPDKRRDVFLIYREALNNLVRYSGATEAFISVSRHGAELTIAVRDNGIGFDTQNLPNTRGGNGLKNMVTRAQKIGGTLTVHSTSKVGTSVKLRFETP